jgi:hypothetical protein
VQGVALATRLPLSLIPIKWLTHKWQALRSICWDPEGYAAGIANCNKYLYRLVPGPVGEISTNIYTLLTSNTGLELVDRNAGNAALAAGDFADALNFFDKMAARSRNSGNRLNEIKAILGHATVNLYKGNKPLIDKSLLSRFDALLSELDAPPLIQYLRIVRGKYLS